MATPFHVGQIALCSDASAATGRELMDCMAHSGVVPLYGTMRADADGYVASGVALPTMTLRNVRHDFGAPRGRRFRCLEYDVTVRLLGRRLASFHVEYAVTGRRVVERVVSSLRVASRALHPTMRASMRREDAAITRALCVRGRD